MLDHPGTYGLADAYDALLARTLPAGAPRAAFVSWWNQHGLKNTARGETTRDTAARMTERLRAAGFQVDALERPDSFGWGAWRRMAAEALEAVFPAER